MELHQREYLVAKIITGVTKLKIKPTLTLGIHSLTPEQNYEAQELYQEVFEEAFLSGISIQKEVLEMLIDQNLWSPVEEELIKRVTKDIEDFKVALYKSAFDARQNVAIRRVLHKAKDKLMDLHHKKHVYDFISCEGVAAYARWCWIIENCTFHKNERYNFSEYSISQTLAEYQSSVLDEPQIRELARSEPWRSIWSSSKKEGSLFGKRAIELSEEQRHIVMWSSMYDSIAESPESPSDDAIADDDVLDGWLIIQRREREKSKGEKLFENTTGSDKIANADEVFVMANSQEDIAKIHSLNDTEGKMIIQERKLTVEEEGGSVKHQKFADVKRGLIQDQIDNIKNRAR